MRKIVREGESDKDVFRTLPKLLACAGHSFDRNVKVEPAQCKHNSFMRGLDGPHVDFLVKELQSEEGANQRLALLHRTPIVAYIVDGVYFVIDGNHRLAAVKLIPSIDDITIDFVLHETPLYSTMYFAVKVAERQASKHKLHLSPKDRVCFFYFR